MTICASSHGTKRMCKTNRCPFSSNYRTLSARSKYLHYSLSVCCLCFQVLSAEELSSHIVVNNDTLKLDKSVSNSTLKTLGGNNLVVEYDAQATLVRLNSVG